MKPVLTKSLLAVAAKAYVEELGNRGISELFGVTDGKAIGTYIEAGFKAFISQRYEHVEGNAALGLDFPGLNVDLKVTSIKQPQSSCPFRDATQKVYGLGYHLLVMIYDKADNHVTRLPHLQFEHVLFIEAERTADFQLTSNLLRILDSDGDAEEIDAVLEDKNLPLDPESRRQLAERIIEEPPALGTLTISNALQWRLQYGRAIRAASNGIEGVADLIG